MRQLAFALLALAEGHEVTLRPVFWLLDPGGRLRAELRPRQAGCGRRSLRCGERGSGPRRLEPPRCIAMPAARQGSVFLNTRSGVRLMDSSASTRVPSRMRSRPLTSVSRHARDPPPDPRAPLSGLARRSAPPPGSRARTRRSRAPASRSRGTAPSPAARGSRRSPGCGRVPPGSRPRRCRCRRAPCASRGRRHPRPSSRPSCAGNSADLGVVGDARARPRVVDPHERLAASMAEERDRPLHVVARPAQVDPSWVHRPGVHLGEAVARGELHRVDELRVVPGLDRGVRPPVEPMAQVAAVVEGRGLLECRAARAQAQLHPPLHAVDEIDVAHHDRQRCRPGRVVVAKSTGDEVTQLWETGKLNSMPKVAQAPR